MVCEKCALKLRAVITPSVLKTADTKAGATGGKVHY